MHPFELIKATDVTQAIQGAARSSTAQQRAQIRFVGGGTTLIDLMKLDVERPQTVIDINGLPLNQVEALPDGGLKIGAVVRNCAIWRPLVEICCKGPGASISVT
jgi:xanthine dehydrogenase YagS FAD-binding subunit